MSKLVLPLAGIPEVIRESVRVTLHARGYVIARADGTRLLEGDELEGALHELGNNTSQALFSIDENPENF